MADLPKPGDRVLSLWQPWASLIPLRMKRIETRGWSTAYRGPLWIHAAVRVVGRRGSRTAIGDVDVERDASGLLLRGAGWPYRLPLGAIVARVDLADVVPVEDLVWYGNTAEMHGGRHWVQFDNEGPGAPAYVEVDAFERPYGDYTPGRFAWLLDGIEPIRHPVPMRGRQGLWRIPEAVTADG